MGAVEDATVGIVSHASDESKEGVEHSHEHINIAITEHEDLKTVLLHVNLGIRAEVLEGNLVLASEVESLHVLHLGVAEQEPVLAEQGLGLLGVHGHDHVADVVGVTGGGVGKGQALETHTVGISDSVGLGGQITYCNGEEIEWILVILMDHTVVASEEAAVLLSLLIGFQLLKGVLKIHSLSLIVMEELLLGVVDGLGHA